MARNNCWDGMDRQIGVHSSPNNHVTYCRRDESPARVEHAQLKATLSAAAEGLKVSVAKCALMSTEIQQDLQIARPLLLGIRDQVTAICASCFSLQVSL